MNQRSRQVVDQLQGQTGDHQVQRAVPEGQRFLVRQHARPVALGQQGGRRLQVEHDLYAWQVPQPPPDQAMIGAEHQRVGKRALDGGEAFHDIVRHAREQELMPRRPRRDPVAARDEQAAVEDVVLGCHVALLLGSR